MPAMGGLWGRGGVRRTGGHKTRRALIGEGPRGLAKVCDLRQCYRRLPTDLAAHSGIIHAGHGRIEVCGRSAKGLWPLARGFVAHAG
jgi:hypothetical protein